MKDKILTFIIGALVGAIIASIAFYCYSKNNTNQKFTPGDRPSMSDQNGNGGTPPDMPNGNGGPGGNGAPSENQDGNSVPEKPSDDNRSNNEVSNDEDGEI